MIVTGCFLAGYLTTLAASDDIYERRIVTDLESDRA
jgi:hypothetical protein